MSITDGSVICALCGEWRTTCALCVGEEKLIDRRREIRRELDELRQADYELWQQEKCIRDAAARRRGEL